MKLLNFLLGVALIVLVIVMAEKLEHCLIPNAQLQVIKDKGIHVDALFYTELEILE